MWFGFLMRKSDFSLPIAFAASLMQELVCCRIKEDLSWRLTVERWSMFSLMLQTWSRGRHIASFMGRNARCHQLTSWSAVRLVLRCLERGHRQQSLPLVTARGRGRQEWHTNVDSEIWCPRSVLPWLSTKTWRRWLVATWQRERESGWGSKKNPNTYIRINQQHPAKYKR